MGAYFLCKNTGNVFATKSFSFAKKCFFFFFSTSVKLENVNVFRYLQVLRFCCLKVQEFGIFELSSMFIIVGIYRKGSRK